MEIGVDPIPRYADRIGVESNIRKIKWRIIYSTGAIFFSCIPLLYHLYSGVEITEGHASLPRHTVHTISRFEAFFFSIYLFKCVSKGSFTHKRCVYPRGNNFTGSYFILWSFLCILIWVVSYVETVFFFLSWLNSVSIKPGRFQWHWAGVLTTGYINWIATIYCGFFFLFKCLRILSLWLTKIIL